MSSLPRATVHLENIVANWRTLAALNPKTTTSAVVKANAYGLGAAKVAPALAKAGCDTFFVAYPEEGAVVREAIGPGPAIFVLNGPSHSTVELFRAQKLTAVLSSEAHVALWAETGGLPCALHFDTGMNRLGLPKGQPRQFGRLLSRTGLWLPADPAGHCPLWRLHPAGAGQTGAGRDPRSGNPECLPGKGRRNRRLRRAVHGAV